MLYVVVEKLRRLGSAASVVLLSPQRRLDPSHPHDEDARVWRALPRAVEASLPAQEGEESEEEQSSEAYNEDGDRSGCLIRSASCELHIRPSMPRGFLDEAARDNFLHVRVLYTWTANSPPPGTHQPRDSCRA